ncbi:hypothetical protein Q9S71_12820 [Microbacterium sp. KSW4-11]|uniref:Uncharacterized protein n=1 Tax=Microbacterium gawkjiense TaxID=3067309 RepID=A0ABU3GF86_9MICO|nr:hypothetical protein [Microbacterium sp. KSW4-11]MDT3317702.1 hypothetical protein [Microbacterium sp. KSW4-11]
MDPEDELPRLHHHAVDPAALEGEGEPFVDLVRRCGADPIPVPVAQGWRILRQQESGAVIGAPADADRQTWWVGTVHEGESVWAEESPARLRGSYAERRRGLALRWPAGQRPDAGPDGFAIDIINEGERRWEPDGDTFHVVGAVAGPEESRTMMMWMATSGTPAVALDPGEYARVPVVIDRESWAQLQPGEATLRAWLVPLRVMGEPLPITVTVESIEAVRPSERWEDSGWSLREMTQELNQQRAVSDAASRLPDIVAALEGTMTDDEAVAAMAARLEVDESAADAIFNAFLRDLHPASADDRRERIAELEQMMQQERNVAD